MSDKIKLSNDFDTDKSLIEKAQKIKDKSFPQENAVLAEVIDEKSFESPATHHSQLPVLIMDLDVPSQTKGPFSDIDKQRWQVVVEQMLVRGVKSGREVSRITGLSVPTACNFVKDVKDALSNDVTPARINQTRELLYSENQNIADFCWTLIRTDPTDSRVPQLLKIIGDTNQRRSRLMGLEHVQIAISKAGGEAEYDIEAAQRQTAAKLGVNIGALKEMGNFLATKINALPDPKDGGDADGGSED